MVAPTPALMTSPRTLLAGLYQKQQAVADVIEGRASLVEAAARFRTADGPQPDLDGETLCRSVTGWVSLALGDRPERAELVTGLLEHELQSHLRRFGRLPVPE